MKKDAPAERQTDLTYEELVFAVRAGGYGRYPTCFFLNELLGFVRAGDERVTQLFCELLGDSQTPRHDQYTVYVGLSSILNPTEEVQRVLRDFCAKPESQALMRQAESVIQEERRRILAAL
ncbi:MAG: hypothetical protein HYT21_00350 [Candidatus Nealsonbacteria bacterium]|nr:hypothetical protein [Candidatus Nealsonbacteria bacterium]